MDSTLNLLQPFKQSFANGETEKQLKSLFEDVFEELFSAQISDIHHYGMPHMGSPMVVERFTKQDGLVVLRRPNSSDLIMRVIYANWKSLGSKRGLAFLEFVLQMLLGDQWKIHRLYHSKARIDRYPTLTTTSKVADSFLTSRIMIDLDQSVNFAEILELLPTLLRLVPANIVPTLSSSIDFQDMDQLQIGAGFIPYMSAYYQYLDYDAVNTVPWSDWVLNSYITVRGDGTVTYGAYRSNSVDVNISFAVWDIKPAVLASLSKPSFQGLAGVLSAIRALDDNVVSHRVIGNTIRATVIPNVVNYSSVMDMLLLRLSQDSSFIGIEPLTVIIEYFDWFIEQNQVKKTMPAPLNMRARFKFSSSDVVSLSSHTDAARKQIQLYKQSNPNWANRQLQRLFLENETPSHAYYIQSYQENGVYGEYYFGVEKNNNPEFVAEDATVKVIVKRALVVDAINIAKRAAEKDLFNLSTLLNNVGIAVDSAYTFGAYEPSNALAIASEKVFTHQAIADQIILNLLDPDLFYFRDSKVYVNAVASSISHENPSERLINMSQLIPQFNNNEKSVIYRDLGVIPITNISLGVAEYA